MSTFPPSPSATPTPRCRTWTLPSPPTTRWEHAVILNVGPSADTLLLAHCLRVQDAQRLSSMMTPVLQGIGPANAERAVSPLLQGKHSIGVLYYLLARMVLQMRGTISPANPWDVMVDLFFYREPEEVSPAHRARMLQSQITPACCIYYS